MSIVKLNTIKQWFKTGLKPTQVQFWNTWDSFWHKEDQIPASNIENLEVLLADKAENEALLQHFKDNDAHGLKKVRDELKKKGVTLEIKDNIIQLKDKEGNSISEIKLPKVKNNQTVSFKSGEDNPNGSEEAQKFIEASNSNQLLFWEGKSTGAEKEIVSTIYYYHRITKIWYVLSPWDSYWHKLDKIPIKNILDLPETLINKVDNTDLQKHINDDDTHGLKKVRDELIKKGTKLTFKNNKLSLLSANDNILSEIELHNSTPDGFYSEGVFIPYLTDLGGGATYSGAFSGSYVKVGNTATIHVNMRRIVTKGIPTGSLLIEGMPFEIKLPSGFTVTRFYNASIPQNPIQTKAVVKTPVSNEEPTESMAKSNNSLPVITQEKIYSVSIGTDSGGKSLGVKLKNDTNVSLPQYTPPITFVNGYITFSGSCIVK